MATMIDKVKVASATNIATAGYKTLLILLTNAASGAENYKGTAAEAATLKDGTTVNVADNASGTNAVEIDAQYVIVRTQAGTKNAFLEVVLGEAYVSTIVLPSNITATARLLTQPAISEV